MHELIEDIRHALRNMRRRPAFTLVVVLSLTLGIGATTAVFSITNTLLFAPLPFEDGEEIVRLRDVLVQPGSEPRLVGMSPRNYFALREQARSFTDLGAQDYSSFNLVSDEGSVRLEGAYVSANVMPLLGVEPILGRGIAAEDDRPGAPAPVVVLGYDLWQRQFGGDPAVLGRDLRLNDRTHTVIGVMPRLFQFPYQAELWVPLGLERDGAEGPLRHYLYTVARLAPGVDRERAQAELDTIGARLAERFPESNTNWELWVVPVREDLTDDVQARLLAVLLAASGFLLLIACTNVASMFLARSLEQGRDMAVRSALGAGRGRLVRKMVVQGLVFALVSGVAGVVLAYLAVPPIVALSPVAEMNVFFQTVHLDLRVLGFALLLSVLVGVVFSLAPAVRASRPDLQGTLKEEGRTSTSRVGRRLLFGFVVVEVAVAVTLLIGAGLMLRSFRGLLEVETGFPTEDLLIAHVALPDSSYPEDRQRVQFLERVVERIGALPGVESAAATSTHPLDRARVGAQASIADLPPTEDSDIIVTNHRLVGPGYLETLGVELLAGRTITRQDQAESRPVAVVSQTFAETFWPGEDPIGKRVKQGPYDSDVPWRDVVGVVDDVLDAGDFENTWYLPYTQAAFPTENVSLLVRTAGNPLAQVGEVRQAVWSVDPNRPIFQVASMEQRLVESYGQERFSSVLFSLFAVLGLVLAVLGVYGILSYSVVQQRGEMGLRMALGAAPGDILRHVLGRGLRLALVGAGCGLLAALLLNRLISSFLYGVSGTDPWTYGVILVGSVLTALLASYLPARRAARIDPQDALHHE